MATRARGGGTGMAVALVVFVLLFVFSLIAAIVIFTKVEEAERIAADTKSEMAVFIKPTEVTREDVKKLRDFIKEDNTNESVVIRLMTENEKLRRAIASTTDLPTTQALPELLRARGLGKEGTEGKSLVAHIEGLSADVKSLQTREQAAAAKVQELQASIAMLEKEKKDIEDRYRAADKTRSDQITSISDANTAAKTNADEKFKSMQDALTAAAEESAKKVEALVQEMAGKDAEIADLRIKLDRVLQTLNPGGDKGSAAGADREIDGTVLSLIPQENLVTIDLGAKDHVLLGLTFEVFDKKTGVTREFGDLRGKATIEVIRVKETSSECRVVRQDRGKPLMPGDVIANVVYDRYRTYKFFVYGNFDIDNDGRPSPTDTRRIKSMIEQWGGVVATEFDYDVDFLVLGVKPQARQVREGEGDIRTPEEIEAAARIAEEALKYEQLAGNARLLRVPVLNQNRFLTLIGYYVRE